VTVEHVRRFRLPSACVSYGYYLNTPQARALDRSLHQPRGLGVVDELVDVRKPRSEAFGDCHRREGSVEAVFQDTRVGYPSRRLKECWAGRGQHFGISGAHEFETGAYRLNRSQFCSLQHAAQNDFFDALARDRNANPGLVRIADSAN